MKLIRVSYLLLVMALVLGAAAYGQAPSQSEAQTKAPLEAEPQVQVPSEPAPVPEVEVLPSSAATLPFLELGLQFDDSSAAPVEQSNGPRARMSTLANSERGLDAARACEWYDISCSNGTTDECCGSSSSCLSYCAEVCGGPCIEVQ